LISSANSLSVTPDPSRASDGSPPTMTSALISDPSRSTILPMLSGRVDLREVMTVVWLIVVCLVSVDSTLMLSPATMSPRMSASWPSTVSTRRAPKMPARAKPPLPLARTPSPMSTK
jgi:hypothetical protein